MTAEAALAPPPEAKCDDAITLRLQSLLRPEFLIEFGWDAEQLIAQPSADHPLLGYTACRVTDCDTQAMKVRDGICGDCRKRWRASGQPLEDYLATWRRPYTGPAGPCSVPGCERHWRSSLNTLCRNHDEQKRGYRITSIEEFIAHPRVRPLPFLGLCPVVACHRPRKNSQRCCSGHNWRWREDRKKNPALDFEQWCRTTGAIAQGTLQSLRGLPELVVAEILYAVQQRLARHTRMEATYLRLICDTAREQGISTISELHFEPRTRLRALMRIMVDDVRRGLGTPELEALKDIWDMEVFGLGHNRRMDFTSLHQEWMRRAAKAWVLEDIPRRYGKNIPNVLMQLVTSLTRLSESLRINRTDHGNDPAQLHRTDIITFQQRLAYLERTGEISATLRVSICRWCARLLRDIREMGLTRPPQMLSALPDDFAFRKGDIPRPPDDRSRRGALPGEVLEQLTRHLLDIQTCRKTGRRGDAAGGRHTRIALEVLIDTGRRPDEVQKLAWDCLETDRDGKSVLIYTDFKTNRLGCRLPIPDSTAELITEQKNRVRTRYPNTAPGELTLFPNPLHNPDGTKPYRNLFLADLHREWLNTIPPLLRADGTEFPKTQITLYTYRRSYAQRHADAGTPVDVLRELMGHKSLNTTQTYYRVTEKRTRQAIDRLVSHQFDRHGDRLWDQAKVLLDHEHARMRVGQVSVPFGICVEPSNVKAAGHACPFRFRCLGCDHFRTDPSYLPELRTYLDTLLRNRERLAAATELDDWARTEATPSEEEITRLRQLIRRVETDVEDLTDDERHQIHQATATLRQSRSVNIGMPGIRPPTIDLRRQRDA